MPAVFPNHWPNAVLGVLVWLALGGLWAPGLAAAPAPVVDLPYGSHGLELDLYPSSSTGPQPVLVLCHGGSYVTGDKREFPWLATALAERGLAVVAINYRLGGVADAENETEAVSMVYADVLEAFSWIKDHAAEYNLDTNRVLIGGGSSGGHMSIATGILYPAEPHPPVRLVGVVGMYGGYFTEHLSANAAPLMILQGTDDRACLPEASRYMAGLYRAAGAWCRFVLVEGMIHDWGGSRYFEKLVDQIVAFVEQPGTADPGAEDVYLPSP